MSKIHFPIVSHMKYMSETIDKTLGKDDKVICYYCDAVFPVYGNVVVSDMFDNKALRCPECGGKLSDVRHQNGRYLTHCFACHFEFFLEGEK